MYDTGNQKSVTFSPINTKTYRTCVTDKHRELQQSAEHRKIDRFEGKHLHTERNLEFINDLTEDSIKNVFANAGFDVVEACQTHMLKTTAIFGLYNSIHKLT